MSIDVSIPALVPEVDPEFRASLERALQTLRHQNDPISVLLGMSRPSLRLVGEVLRLAGHERPSDNLYDCIITAASGDESLKKTGLKLLPVEMATCLHTIRTFSNKADHDAEQVTLSIADAENVLSLFLRVMDWFYCEYKQGPQLKTIYVLKPEPLAEGSPQNEAIRKVTASECGRIKFLGGEGDMDQGYYRKLTIRGRRPADQTEIAQAIENLISETLGDRVGRWASRSSLKRRAEESDHGESWPIISLDDRILEKCAIEPRGQLRALLLTDEPGGGKSTTVRNVAWRVAVRTSPFENEQRVPVYLRLRDWENSTRSPSELAHYLEDLHSHDPQLSTWSKRAFWEQAFGEEKLENGQLFLVLDGLDELSAKRKFAGDLLDVVQKLARQGNVVLITCRTRSLRAYKSKLTDFEIVRINGLDPEEIREFVRNYPSLPNRDGLVDQLKGQPTMLELVREPFLLDVICYLAAEGKGKLPECRSELIEKAIDRLLLDSDLDEFHWPDDNVPGNNDLRRVLARASLLLRLREGKDQIYNLFSFDTFEDAVQIALRQEESDLPTATVLTRFFSRLRFLQFPSQRELSGDDIGSFSHSLFLDFLAAEGLKLIIQPSASNGNAWNTSVEYFPNNQSPNMLVADRAFDPAWFELLSFLPSRLLAPKRFFEILSEEMDDLSRRRATLAICGLGELPSVTLGDEEVRQWAEPLAQSCWEIATIHWELGVTSLAEALLAEISNVGRAYPGLVERLAHDLQSPSLQTRLDALTGLDRIGMAAAPIDSVINGLLNNLHDRNWSVRKLASAAVAKMGPLALRPTVQRLETSNEWHEQASACEAIGLMGASALFNKDIDVVALLLRCLGHKQPLVRASACEALGNLGSSIPGIEEIVSKMMSHANETEKDSTVRAQACAALGKYGVVAARSEAVLDSLMASLAHDDWVVRTSASAALGELARETALNGLYLLNGLRGYLEADSEVRASVCLTLGKLHSVFSAQPDSIAHLLVKHLEDEDLNVCKCASESIHNLGIRIAQPGIFGRLLDFLEDSDWQVRTAAVEAIGNLMDSAVGEIDQMLVRLFMNLQDDRWYVRACSCEVLGQLARTFVNTRPMIISKLMEVLYPSEGAPIDTEGYVSVKAIRALGNVGLRREPASGIMQRLVGFLEDDNWQIRVAACESFGDIGPEAAEVDGVQHGLIECLKSKVWCVRANACKTIGRILPFHFNGKHGLEELIACACDAQQPVRTEAAETLMRLAGAGNMGMRFVLNPQQKILWAARKGEAPVEIAFPKPTPPLFGQHLHVFSSGQPNGI